MREPSTQDTLEHSFMAQSRKYRLWTDEEKRSICLQTRAPGVSVAQVARRYAMNANLIFKWLKDLRYAPGRADALALHSDLNVTGAGRAR